MIYSPKPFEGRGEREARAELSCRPCLLSFRRSPRQSIVPNDDRHLTTPIRLNKSDNLIFPSFPLSKVAQGTYPPFPPSSSSRKQ
jgi:hypothetical protein